MLTRQAKVLTGAQTQAVLAFLRRTRHPDRNCVIFLLTVRAGLRAKEVAELRWSMVTDAEGHLTSELRLTDDASKGQTGGVIPLARELRAALEVHLWASGPSRLSDTVIVTERGRAASAQVVVNMMRGWYRSLGFDGCSSHSGRRTFITNAARNIGRVGGSLRDVQALARHSSLATTQRYIQLNGDAIRKVVDLN